MNATFKTFETTINGEQYRATCTTWADGRKIISYQVHRTNTGFAELNRNRSHLIVRKINAKLKGEIDAFFA